MALWAIGAMVLLAIVFVAGPRPATDSTITFDAKSLPSDLDAYLAAKEKAVKNLISGAEAEIVWADPDNKEKTEIAIVYIHGFSATKHELRPVPDLLAQALDANMFMARLSGHGTDGSGLAKATMADWVNDFAEAIAIGERLGDKIILISASTGSTLATWGLAEKPDLTGKVMGNIMVSPNFALRAVSTSLLNMPWAETLLPALMGAERSWEPHNELHGKWWTTAYPSKAVFPMGALMQEANAANISGIKVPTIVFMAPDDLVIDPQKARDVISKLGGKSEIVEVTDTADPSKHVIAGDILSPNTTARITGQMIDWASSL